MAAPWRREANNGSARSTTIFSRPSTPANGQLFSATGEGFNPFPQGGFAMGASAILDRRRHVANEWESSSMASSGFYRPRATTPTPWTQRPERAQPFATRFAPSNRPSTQGGLAPSTAVRIPDTRMQVYSTGLVAPASHPLGFSRSRSFGLLATGRPEVSPEKFDVHHQQHLVRIQAHVSILAPDPNPQHAPDPSPYQQPKRLDPLTAGHASCDARHRAATPTTSRLA